MNWFKKAKSRLQEAIERFGFTNDFREAGYILTDRSMLDLSRKRECVLTTTDKD